MSTSPKYTCEDLANKIFTASKTVSHSETDAIETWVAKKLQALLQQVSDTKSVENRFSITVGCYELESRSMPLGATSIAEARIRSLGFDVKKETKEDYAGDDRYYITNMIITVPSNKRG